jgi:acyl carrier protein
MAGPARCLNLPQTDAELLARIRCFVADALDRSVELIGSYDHLYETLGLDSLGAVAVFIDMSYEFGIPEPASDLEFSALNTARLLADYARSFDKRAAVA